MTGQTSGEDGPGRLRPARVLRVTEEWCEVWSGGRRRSARYAPQLPTPRSERISPGHLVALATSPAGGDVVVWRWYDAVVVETRPDRQVLLWEPAHGEVSARAGEDYRDAAPGSRAYASSGLPGADWWVAGPVTDDPEDARVELAAVIALYTGAGLWPAALGG